MLPREHGLTVTWAATIVLSAISFTSYSVYGAALLLASVPTITLYDSAIASLRISRIRKRNLAAVLNERLSGWQKADLVLVLALLLYGVGTGNLSPWPLLFPIVVAALLILGSRLLNERSMAMRSFSLIFVTSQYVVLNSAITGMFGITEIRIFIIFTLINLILVAGARQIINSRIQKKDFGKGFAALNVPLLGASMAILYFATEGQAYLFMVFIAVFIAATGSFALIRNKPVKIVGISSSVWIILAAAILFAALLS